MAVRHALASPAPCSSGPGEYVSPRLAALLLRRGQEEVRAGAMPAPSWTKRGGPDLQGWNRTWTRNPKPPVVGTGDFATFV